MTPCGRAEILELEIRHESVVVSSGYILHHKVGTSEVLEGHEGVVVTGRDVLHDEGTTGEILEPGIVAGSTDSIGHGELAT